MGKGSKERVVPLEKKAQKALLKYMTLFRQDQLLCLWLTEERRNEGNREYSHSVAR